ncbi:hypothetical protein GJ688_15455 [Heliobacillus mobilis]|uniref:MORN repeat-containing protein n=1 Tax=Heliobacterium mobile TaxID=28064 RepID=A0A6I3SNQ5_HELMO|nr:hypothetical protein [Heliobacterium mobile]MTV50366.1 hypothetical protein [Heliobacterium mobile]
MDGPNPKIVQDTLATVVQPPEKLAKQAEELGLQQMQEFLTPKETTLEDYIPLGKYYLHKRLVAWGVVALLGLILVVYLKPPAFLIKWVRPYVKFSTLADAGGFSGNALIQVLQPDKSPFKYIGNLVDGKFAGPGTLYDPNDRPIYIGEFKEGMKEGQGEQYADGTLLYKGGFANDLYQGEGTLFDGEGNICFSGKFEAGVKSGEGKEYFLGKEKALAYAGNYLNGKRSGPGIEYFANGLPKYNGNFLAGAYSGTGTLFDENGHAVYTGEFTQGLYAGIGTLYHPDGKVIYKGYFDHGNIESAWFLGLSKKKVIEVLGDPTQTIPLLNPAPPVSTAASPVLEESQPSVPPQTSQAELLLYSDFNLSVTVDTLPDKDQPLVLRSVRLTGVAAQIVKNHFDEVFGPMGNSSIALPAAPPYTNYSILAYSDKDDFVYELTTAGAGDSHEPEILK